MTTIRYHLAAGGMLATMASVLFAGSAFAQEAGKARLTDIPAQASSAEAGQELIIRGSSDIRRRNAQTTQALKSLFAKDESLQASGAAVQQVAHEYVMPAGACCPTDECCPTTCAAPPQCCAPDACAPECCAPSNCCAPQAGCAPFGCGCPAGTCDCGASCACPSEGCCCPDACDGCAAVGRVHIGDNFALVGCTDDCDASGCGFGDGNGNRGRRHGRACKHGYGHGDCPFCNSRSCLNRNCAADLLCEHAAAHRARNRLASYNLNQYLHCKFGCLIHDGNGGVGSPLFGHYSIVYPADAGHFDSRDGGVYAAQGYGGAVSVPLAPTVRYAWNYGWGIPSSRLTPVSNTPAP
jgi:hypothetical protein